MFNCIEKQTNEQTNKQTYIHAIKLFSFNNLTFWLYEIQKKKKKFSQLQVFTDSTEEKNMESHKYEGNYMESSCSFKTNNYLITTTN